MDGREYINLVIANRTGTRSTMTFTEAKPNRGHPTMLMWYVLRTKASLCQQVL
uniref:Uncharacterized protein n=1 Tax=Aegilops tauschii subsp. strangulata TaxID=200361 RepID=A0A453M6A6_AEGTS